MPSTCRRSPPSCRSTATSCVATKSCTTDTPAARSTPRSSSARPTTSVSSTWWTTKFTPEPAAPSRFSCVNPWRVVPVTVGCVSARWSAIARSRTVPPSFCASACSRCPTRTGYTCATFAA
uniref:(northern house mosquito) hypothetical protein n=1 Tax=Culex pipiens TaxID=7175 RepID=A0A8D8KLP7_CULPI